MKEDVDSIINKIYGDIRKIKKHSIDNSKKISKIYDMIAFNYENLNKENELTDKGIYGSKYDTLKLNDYTKIILKDFESRISILEEENQSYKN